MTIPNVTAFCGHTLLAAGPLPEVARVVWGVLKEDALPGNPSPTGAVLVFEDATGRVIDLEMRGDERRMLAHLDAMMRQAEVARANDQHDGPYAPDATDIAPRPRGRPKLGVVAREITLLPRHWEWLAAQPGGASVALRKLVEAARRAPSADDRVKAARDVAYRFMQAIAGDLIQFEEVIRALYRGDEARFRELIADWPRDIAAYSARLAFPKAEMVVRAR